MNFDIGDCPMSFRKQKYFVLETIFHTWQCMCEGIDEDSRHGEGHLDIHVESYMFLLECVWMCEYGTACALRWGVTLIGEFIY